MDHADDWVPTAFVAISSPIDAQRLIPTQSQSRQPTGFRLHRDRLLCFFFSRFRNRPAALHPEQTALPRQKSGDSLLVLWANTLALMTAKIAKMAMPFAAPIDDSSKSLETTGTI
jgi:hypothetical protein